MGSYRTNFIKNVYNGGKKMNCLQGFTTQEECNMCDACVTYGINACVKGLNQDERNSTKCNFCGMCRG